MSDDFRGAVPCQPFNFTVLLATLSNLQPKGRTVVSFIELIFMF